MAPLQIMWAATTAACIVVATASAPRVALYVGPGASAGELSGVHRIACWMPEQ